MISSHTYIYIYIHMCVYVEAQFFLNRFFFVLLRFEQFLINYCNEKIQQYFIKEVMDAEQHIYLQEGLRWKTVKYTDNSKCIELIEKKAHGVIALLQEQCMLPKGNDKHFSANLTRVMVTNEKLMLCERVKNRVCTMIYLYR